MGPKDMRMFYHSFNAATQRWTLGTATSKDGFVWKKAGPIFAGSDAETDFDGRGAAACHVVRDFTTKRCASPLTRILPLVIAECPPFLASTSDVGDLCSGTFYKRVVRHVQA